MRIENCPHCKSPLAFSLEAVHCYFCQYHKDIKIDIATDRYLEQLSKTMQHNTQSRILCEQKLTQALSMRYKKGSVVYLQERKYTIYAYLTRTRQIILKSHHVKPRYYAIPFEEMPNRNKLNLDEYVYTPPKNL